MCLALLTVPILSLDNDPLFILTVDLVGVKSIKLPIYFHTQPNDTVITCIDRVEQILTNKLISLKLVVRMRAGGTTSIG